MRPRHDITLDYHLVRESDLPAAERLFIGSQLHLEVLLDIRDLLAQDEITSTYAFPPQGDPGGDETPLTPEEYERAERQSHLHP